MPMRCCHARAWRRRPRRCAARPRRRASPACPGRARTRRLYCRSYLGSADELGASLVQHDIELPPGRRVDFENLEKLVAVIGKGMDHAGGDVDHVVLTDHVGLALNSERALAAFDDIDVIYLGMVMALAAHSAGKQPIEMQVELLGTETCIDQLDLLASSFRHRICRALIQMQDLEHVRSPVPSLPQHFPACNIERTVIVPPDRLKHAAAKTDTISRTGAIARAHGYFDSGDRRMRNCTRYSLRA